MMGNIAQIAGGKMNQSEIKEGYPLQYPIQKKRTLLHEREYARFRTTFAKTRDSLLNEIRLLGGKYPIISSNLMLKRDGIPYANQQEPEDSGVAVYFELFGKQQCIPCDKWKKVVNNITAIEKTINALRGIERWGGKDMVEASFQGFLALPSPDQINKISNIQYFADCINEEEKTQRYKILIKKLHPDVGGTNEEFIELNRQYNTVSD